MDQQSHVANPVDGRVVQTAISWSVARRSVTVVIGKLYVASMRHIDSIETEFRPWGIRGA